MLAFILRRMLQSIAVMAVVAFIAFGLFNFTGDPVAFMVGQDATAEEKAQLRAELGLDQPFYVQFARFVGNARAGRVRPARCARRARCRRCCKERLPATLELAIAAALLALVRRHSARRLHGAATKHAARARAAGGVADRRQPADVPDRHPADPRVRRVAGLAAVVRARRDGRVRLVDDRASSPTSGLKALILPAITLSLFQMTLIMRLVRAEMLEVLRTDYIKFARARGLTDRAIHFGHALKNTLVPVITITGLQLGAIIAFAIITETVFQWPGMGLLFIQAVNFADIPVMAAYLCLIALVFVVINLVVDLLYYAVDPRLRIERGGGALSTERAEHADACNHDPVDHIRSWHDDFTAIRRDLHAHPELGFEEHRTARVVQRAARRALGIEHHTGIGKTGIVAVDSAAARPRAAARSACAPTWTRCRCRRRTTFAHKSRYDGRMHGCGHDGHTTMLLAAARYLHETRSFDGTVYCIFQPGEEGYAGAKAMIDDGLFERFPAEQVYALHNWPGLPPGKIGITPGPGDGRGRPHRDHDRRPRRPRRASARGDRPGAGRGPHHHRRAVDRQPQREPDRHRGGEPVRDARGPSRRDERDPGAREARRAPCARSGRRRRT